MISEKHFLNTISQIRVWLRLIYKITEDNCRAQLFTKFIQTDNSSSAFLDKISILTWRLLEDWHLSSQKTFLWTKPTNTPCVFHVETTWKRSFPCSFNVEYTWYVCRETPREQAPHEISHICRCNFNPFLAGVPFLNLLKMLENLWFSEVFKGV